MDPHNKDPGEHFDEVRIGHREVVQRLTSLEREQADCRYETKLLAQKFDSFITACKLFGWVIGAIFAPFGVALIYLLFRPK